MDNEDYFTKKLLKATSQLLERGTIKVVHCGVCNNDKKLSDDSECQACK
tara:strand:- start:224 stop:370 length:147 start_codon:yes stop_codon:yes gene_type:complete